MARYICKCGRVVNKSTNADNTGNRNTDGCEGCPYLLPWGPFAYKPGDGYVMDVKGKECRMSPSIDYTSTYYGSADDKCTLRIISLDLDFLEEIQAWMDRHSGGQLYGVFSRKNIRGTDYSNNGRYSWSIACAQNKQGMAAKAALIQKFFRPDKSRRDKMPDEEKAIVLAAIEAGKAACQRKKESMKQEYIISENIRNECLYAYANSKFWVYDKHTKKWYISDFCREQYEKAHNQMPQLLPEDFLADSLDYTQMDDYELPSPVLNALLVAVSTGKREKAPFEVADDHPTGAAADASPCAPGASDALSLQSQSAAADAQQDGGDNDANPTQAAPACPADAGAATQSLSAADAASLAADPTPAAFDFGADAETNMALMQDAQVFMAGSMARVMAAKRAHDRTANNYRGSWGKWCDLVGISRDTGDNMVRVAEQFGNIQINGQNLIDVQPLKLLYAASKASTPPEIRERVENLDITTHKQFKELEAQLKAERQARERAEQRLEEAHQAHQAERESTSALLREEQQRRQAAEERRIAAEKDKADARQQAKEAQARGKQDAALVEKLQDILLQRDNEVAEQKERADAAELRARQAESRPVEVAVQAPTEEQINAAAKQRTAMLEAQLHTLQTQLDDAEKRADAAAGSAYLSAAEFAGQAAAMIDGIWASFWAMAKELPDTDFNQALEPLDRAVSRIYNREWEDGWDDSWENEEDTEL